MFYECTYGNPMEGGWLEARKINEVYVSSFSCKGDKGNDKGNSKDEFYVG